MAHYYYLGAQLPHLVFGQNPPMSSEAFKLLAREMMNSADAAMLNFCTLDPDPIPEDAIIENEPENSSYLKPASRTSSSLINRWKEWERSLRLNLARDRAVKLKREPGNAPDSPMEAVTAAKHAMTIESPLEAEIFLDKSRWDAIESFIGIDIFSESAIYAYLLKLLLMERRTGFLVGEGFEEYRNLYDNILGSTNISLQDPD